MKRIARLFNWLKCLGGIPRLQPTAECQMSTSILGVDYINISCKIPNDKALVHLEFKSKVLPGSLYYLSAWLGFRTSSPQQCINCQPRYWWGGVGSINISCKIPKCKVLAYNWHMCLDGIEHLNPTGRCQISTVILGEGSMNISCKFPTAKFLPTWLVFKRKVYCPDL